MNHVKFTIDPEKREQFEKLVHTISLMNKCIGWNNVDKMLFMPLVPKCRKRLRKKKAKTMRLECIGDWLRTAGLKADPQPIRVSRRGRNWRHISQFEV